MIKKFIDWLNAQVGSIYVWGAQGEVGFDEAWIRKRETSSVNANRAIAFYNKQKAKGLTNIAAYDCSGLIVRFLLDNGLIKSDTTAAGLYRLCKGIQRQDLKIGDFVFRSGNAGVYHVGVYVGQNEVIHARGRDHGVVKETLDANGNTYWNKYGRFEQLNDKQKESIDMELSILKNGSKSNEVKAVQILLNGFGFDCGKVDGSFGVKTETAVKAFQSKAKLTVDGIVGQQTWSLLLKGGITHAK